MIRFGAFAILLALPVVPAVAQTQDHAPVGLPSSAKMTKDDAKGESWSYIKPDLDLRKYGKVIVDQTAVYRGADAQFSSVTPENRTKFAGIVTEELRNELAQSFPIVTKADANTLRIRVTLLGVKETTGGVATATRVMPMGLATNAVKSIAGKKGSFTGSVLYAVEVFDGPSGELLVGGVRRRSPDALDIPATLSTSDTVRAVARDFAENVRKKLEKATGRSK